MAPKTVARPIIGARKILHLIVPVKINISPIKFGSGGSPRLAAQAISHHMGSKTVIILKPRVIKMLRVWVRSYSMLAKANNAEETSP